MIKGWVLCFLLCGYFYSNSQDPLSIQKPERLFQTGLDLLSHHEYGAALKTFDDFKKIYPINDSRRADAEYYQAFCAINLLHADGEKLLEDFIDGHPGYPRAAMAHYDLANYFYTEKNYSKASGYYAKVNFNTLNQEQQNTGRFRWGYSLFSQKNMKESLDQFNAIKAQGGQYGPAASYYAGFIETTSGDYTNALIDLKRAESNDSYASIVPVMIANVYARQKDDDALLRYAEEVLTRESVSSSEEISLLAAEAWYRKGDYKKALPLYRNYLAEYEAKATRGVLCRAGYAAYSTSQDEEAMSYLKGAATDADSVGAYAAYYLGSLYLKRQEKPLALNAFEIAKSFKKDLRLAEESLFQSAKINYDLGKPDLAIAEFEFFQKSFPQSSHLSEIKELLSQAYVNANNYNKAIEYVESLPRRSPAVDMAYQKATFLKATELFNKEDYAQAVQFFEKSLEYPLETDFVVEGSFWCAEAYAIGRRYEQAIPLYERALGHASKPERIRDIRYGLGYSHYNLQHYDKALVSFREFVNKAAASDPNLPDGLIRLADCYYASKSYGDALTHYRKALQANTHDADYAHLQSGIILAIQSKYSEASAELESVYKNPSSRFADDAIYQRAQIDFERSNYASAVELYSRLINGSKSSRLLPYAYMRRAAAYYNLKKYSQTANDYISVLQEYPAHAVTQDVLVPLQEALALSNRSAEFDGYLSGYKVANPGAKGIELVEFEAAKNLYFNQNYAKAIENFSRFVNSYPDSPRVPDAKYYEAESYFRINNLEKSLSLHNQLSTDLTFSLINKVLSRIGELEFKKGSYDKAALAFQKLGNLATNKKEQYTAWNGMMESYYLLAQYDSADRYAHKIIEQGSINASAQNKASLFLGKSAMARGDYETAKDEFLTTLNTARDEYGAEAKYSIAEIFYLSKENKQCYETLLALNRDFAAYDDWVGKSYLLLADNFLAMGDAFQAKGTLKSLVENFPKQNVKDAATEKLKAIDAEEKKKALEKRDTTDN